MKFDKHFENQRLKYEKFDKSLFVNTVDSYKLAFLYISYVHYENNEDDFDNVLNSIVYNRSKSYIDAILVDNNSEDSGMNVYNFTYYEPNRSLDFDEVKKAITSIDKILSQMERGIFEYQTTELINQFRTVESEIDKNSRVIIRIVTNIDANKKAKKDNNKILNEYFKSFPVKHEWEILYSDDILDYIDEVDNPNQAASVGEISIDDDDNTIQYKSERVDAYLVNISAKSLKTLYENNGNKLFGLNLRYYVKNDKVDLGITETISKNKNNFWYMNNGIIIIADKAEFNNNKIRLENFSIINGGQTTKMIGESTFDEDFFLVCKLIVSGRLTEDEKISFISTVADATNSQKQILPKDLIANRVEQRELKKQLQEANIFLEVKRGERKPLYYKEKWQSIKNEKLGQILLSFMYQKPGYARNQKKDILNTRKPNYSTIFEKGPYKTDLIKNLVILNYAYESKYMSKKITQNDSKQNIVVKRNSQMVSISLIGLLVKIIKQKIEVNEIKEGIQNVTEEFNVIDLISSRDVENFSLKVSEKDERELFKLFDHLIEIIKKALITLNDINDVVNKEHVLISNFTKQDSYYQKYVVREFINYLNSDVDFYELAKKVLA
jgi:hypothetical protein